MLKNDLEQEIEKWNEKLDDKLPDVEPVEEDGEELLENALAYRKDSKHFYEEEKLIESFESLVWAWAFIEIGERLDLLKS